MNPGNDNWAGSRGDPTSGSGIIPLTLGSNESKE